MAERENADFNPRSGRSTAPAARNRHICRTVRQNMSRTCSAEPAGIRRLSTGNGDGERASRIEEQRRAAVEQTDQRVRSHHASIALPLSANMPRGRFWMNKMMKTRMAILPSTAPAKGFEELVGDAERERAHQRAPQIADTAEHHDHEAESMM